MEDKMEVEKTTPRGADWEVVSLTASAYAAAPGPDTAESRTEEKGDLDVQGGNETSNALFMSRHFVFPPNRHENLPLEPENKEILGQAGLKDDVSASVKGDGGKPNAKDEENWNLRELTDPQDFHGIPFFDEKDDKLAVDADFAGNTALPGLNLTQMEQSIYGSANFHPLQNEEAMGVLNIDDESRVLAESVQSSEPALGLNLPKQTEEDNYDGSGLPYAAWWKKQAASLYANAKETNTIWSIFVAAAVMGLVVLGQQWQKERHQALHNEWGVDDERPWGTTSPVTHFKDAIVGSSNERDFSAASSER